jgi:hypothetical protein
MEEHGEFKIEIIGAVMIVESFGAWNSETTNRMCNEIKARSNVLSLRPWGSLLDLSMWELATPEIWDSIKELHNWLNQNNHRYQAYVCGCYLHAELIETFQSSFINVKTNKCNTRSNALKWLTNEGLIPTISNHMQSVSRRHKYNN